MAPYARWAYCQSFISGCTTHLGLCLYPQVVHDNYLLYVFAPDRESRQRWVLALKEGNYSPTPMAPRSLDALAGLGSAVRQKAADGQIFLAFGVGVGFQLFTLGPRGNDQYSVGSVRSSLPPVFVRL